MATVKSWLSEYHAALNARDAREQAQAKLINAYANLADRTAALHSQSQPEPPAPSQDTAVSPVPARTTSSFSFRTRSPATKEEPEPSSSPSDALARLRADLTATQKSRADLQARLKQLTAELKQLNTTVTSNASRILSLERDKAQLERRVRDRDDEIKGKAKLVEEIQDEMVSLNLQLNMAEERSGKLERENKELVERWMVRMGREAEEMNERSKWS